MRVSNLSLKNNMVYNIQKNNNALLKVEKQIGSGNRIFKVSDDPAAAIATIYSKVRINQIDQYVENSENARDAIRITHDKLSTVTQIMQRLKELSIQAANGTFNHDDRINIAMEVEELLEEIVALSNSSYDDNYLFSGNKGGTKAFEITTSLSKELGKNVISSVNYNGDQFQQKIEIEKNELVEYSLNGNSVFWAEDHLLVALKDSTNYISPNDQSIKIDNYPVAISTGDDLETIINKINETVPSVRASRKVLPTGENVISLISQYPHQIALEDTADGTLLRDLGLLKEGSSGAIPFDNIHPNTLEHGGSIFDVLIRLRNNLIDNNTRELGGKTLAGIDLGLNNVLNQQAKVSALNSRLDSVIKDLSMEKVSTIERLSQKQDVDVAKATIDFNEINYLHRLSLQAASKYIRPSLLDFL